MNAGGASLFDVVAVAANGAVQSRRVSAPSEQQATQQLQLANLRVLSCRPAPAPRWAFATLVPRRRARLQVSLFTEELAALLDAGLGMVDAIRTLALKERDESARRAIERVATDLTEGLPLSQALTNQPATFPALLIATVAASEQTGDLVSALRRYAAHLETLYELRNKVIGAAIYPALLLTVGALVVLFLLGVVVPRFAQLLEGAHRDLPRGVQFPARLGQGDLCASMDFRRCAGRRRRPPGLASAARHAQWLADSRTAAAVDRRAAGAHVPSRAVLPHGRHAGAGRHSGIARVLRCAARC